MNIYKRPHGLDSGDGETIFPTFPLNLWEQGKTDSSSLIGGQFPIVKLRLTNSLMNSVFNMLAKWIR